MILKHLEIPFSNDMLEKKAYALLRKHSQHDTWLPSLPIPIEDIVERTLDLHITWNDLSDEAPNVLGLLRPTERSVYLNEVYLSSFEDCPGLEHFTLAHEVGHWEMHVDRAALLQGSLFGEEESVIVCRDGAESPEESTANRFAARLLMPEDLLRDALKGCDLRSREGFRSFASSIGVSFSSLHYRLTELRIDHTW